MKILFIDDEPYRHEGFKKYFSTNNECMHVYCYDDAVDALRDNKFDVVFFDNDLAGFRSGTDGIDVVKHLLFQLPETQWPKLSWVHSWNHQAARNIASLLQSAGIKSFVMSFDWESLDRWHEILEEEILVS
jgi:DNA-binding NarL/FixJ family response regulator